MKTIYRALALSMLAVSAAQAADADPVRDPALPLGWYLAPMAAYMKADTARAGDDGFGAALITGNRGEVASLEIWVHHLSPKPTTLQGAGLALLFGPYGNLPVLRNTFGLIGFGVHQRQNAPQYPDDDSTIFGDAGLGYYVPLKVFGRNMALRSELRYRYDTQPPPRPAGTKNSYADLILQVGLQIPLGDDPAPVTEPVAVVPVQEAPAPVLEVAPVEVAAAPDPAPAPEPVAPPTIDTLETAKAGDTIVLEGVNFETSSARLTTNAVTILNGVAAKLISRPDLNFEIGGHTDSRGSDAYNQDLSARRAQSVVQYLSEQGVNPERLTGAGYGENNPVDSNDTADGRERNRRVEVKVLESSTGPTEVTPS